ncbi:MAG: hypothetical protein J7621_26550, partial [Niastella sp.]|nr:hypothetical protein [Niastella sp.]
DILTQVPSTNIPNNDLFNKSTLIAFFKHHVLNESADRHMLITWGHGAGLGFFAERQNALIRSFAFNTEAIKPLQDFVDYSHVERFLRANGYARKIRNSSATTMQKFLKTNNVLANNRRRAELTRQPELLDFFKYKLIPVEDFADILKETFTDSGKKIDVMFTLNCYMQMFETGFCLKDQVDILVAPVTAIPFQGIDYNSLFKKINAGNASPEDIAREIVTSYPKIYENDPNFTPQRYKLTALKLNNHQEMLKQINQYCDIFKDRFTSGATYQSPGSNFRIPFNGHVKRARRNCEDHTKGDERHFIALAEFFVLLNKQFSDLTPRENDLLACSSKIVELIRGSITASFPVITPSSSVEKILPFISIFFPDKKDSPEHHIKFFIETLLTGDDTPFERAFRWDNFLIEYLKTL